jgi:uncharacterized oxidoreductase
MKISGNTILITGGATGIGLSLAEAFVELGNDIIVCGRRECKLQEAKKILPQIHAIRCDISKEEERKSLFDWTKSNFENINILINNAGIQRRIDLKKGTMELFDAEDEIEINLRACVNLSAYFIPLFTKRKEAAIVNVSSGLGFIPLAILPIYSATKAAIHSFTISLRHQLRDTSIKVFELIPPIVDTELDRGDRERRGQKDRGIQPKEIAVATIDGLINDKYEITIGMSEVLRKSARDNPHQAFQDMNQW